MWYEDNNTIRKDKPIFAKSETRTFVLLPQLKEPANLAINENSYTYIGFNWFCLETGKYHSSMFYKTIENAIDTYRNLRYEIFNGELKVYNKSLNTD